jgi:RHH-type proline utilization regulon transcriptional repressor/proline dehydrogenase/delta 1-pyrroline-5-carboxylate dehydrogenase
MDSVEGRTWEIGRDLLRRVRQASEQSNPLAGLHDKAMAAIMGDEAIKTSLFRLVDVLPVLSSARQINRHLKEYLGGSSLGRAVRWLPERGMVGRGVSALASVVVRALARRFIAADEIADAPAAVAMLRERGLEYTIDLLGEAVVSETEADDYAQRYHRLIDTLCDADARGVNVSIKLSSLYSQFDPIDPDGTAAAVLRRLGPIVRRARRRGAFVCIDMEQFAYKDATLHIFKRLISPEGMGDWPGVGIAIQGYLKCGEKDLKELCDCAAERRTPVWVRLVKGAYWDFESVIAAQNHWPLPVFAQKHETDAQFEKLTEFLLQRRGHVRLALASHNIRGIAHALALAESMGLRAGTIEFQMLYGMAPALENALVERGERVRLYAPVGSLLPGMAYLVRRLLENTSNQSFLRSAMLEHAGDEELLMNPANKTVVPRNAPSSDVFQNEPLTDFSQAAAQDSMRKALAAASQRAGERHPLVIGPKCVTCDNWIESINPSHSRQVVGRCAQATAEQARQAIAAAKAAFGDWRQSPTSSRAELLAKVADELLRRRFELAATEVLECGKPWREADADVAEAIDFCRYYAREARRLGQPRKTDVPGETNRHFYEPRGVAAVIAPWNFPLAILCGMTAAAVVTGNTVVMKPAEQSSVVAAMLMEAFERADAPAGVVNYLSGIGEEVGPELIGSPDVAIIAFTGSRQVGLEIQQAAARVGPGQEYLKRVIAEMGGKNAIVIDGDADRDEAIHGVLASAFGYAGQKCSACSRLIVLEEIYEAFLGRLIDAAKSLRIAPAEDPACFVGPVIDGEAFARIHRAIDKGKSEARLAFAADTGALAEEGYFIGPHIFGEVAAQSSLAQEEIFGPVLAVMRAKTFDHALELANGVRYALTGGVYSRSPINIERAAREFRVGDLYVNRKITGALVGRQPFGGFKMSGIGSQAGGPDYLLQFVLPRVVTENTLRHGFAPSEQ